MCRLLQFFLKLFQLFFILFVFVEISRHDSLKGKGSSLPDLIAIGFEPVENIRVDTHIKHGVVFHSSVSALSTLLPKALVNLVSKDPKNFLLDFLILQEQREEILVLGQSLDQSVININDSSILLPKPLLIHGAIPMVLCYTVGKIAADYI